ncbi:MAG: hypothetical protein AUJ52_06720 [Elusimicrobia bacterium CG1_02_63_36]|nr:MAG: hypothetical protein AUJ52_06720 [Elusimicrobia bacterium CG1_02_63_36]PIP83319.1 MAG: hypothetical protein COR54_10155 [Elusimicrobia bacterium CG22_combo_CG10-13_8_21_14_all_63_91]PJA17978.1 MAG: hypothetical protein COX66_02880 [Elusimicrobia bacterium CG_4_10_14_0_2_um_filter_63_34]PJB26405.1 MAG: hypothetical protein CO113_03775 [Elusimicrobia bacterium CG_4_9_14_3_um_filter_62_55]
MGNLYSLPMRLRRALNKLAVFSRSAPRAAGETELFELLWAARVKVGMSQSEAANRARIPQQYWHDLESGKKDARISTWKRAFQALRCDLLVLPKPRLHLGEWRARRMLEGRYAAKTVPRERPDPD